mmetsp:Transcript_32380/g.80571  ORF Transcript_32380/g.80571 Transcript_32380/m.80571 type:complete len:140 (-) Transcript_32380:102-521(-)
MVDGTSMVRMFREGPMDQIALLLSARMGPLHWQALLSAVARRTGGDLGNTRGVSVGTAQQQHTSLEPIVFAQSRLADGNADLSLPGPQPKSASSVVGRAGGHREPLLADLLKHGIEHFSVEIGAAYEQATRMQTPVSAF